MCVDGEGENLTRPNNFMSIRRLHCEKCGTKHFVPMDAEDVLAGWHQRVRHLNVKKPEIHQAIITGGGSREVIDIPTLICDGCGEPIMNGAPAVAITMWRGEEPRDWEKEFQNEH